MDVGDNRIGKEQALNLVSIFKQKDQMKLVGLASCNLGVDGAKAVADYVSVSGLLTAINVGYNGIDQPSARLILDAMKGKNMQSIGMARCSLGVEEAKILAEYVSIMGSLTAVDLSGNQEGDEGMRLIGEALLASTSSKLTSLKCTKLDLKADTISLALRNKGLGPGAAVLLSAAISKFMGSLTSLSVAYNSIVGDGAQQLASAVLAKPNLEHFSGIALRELRADSLTTLDLSGKGLGPPEAIVLADLLRSVSGSLTSLDVTYNQLGEEGRAMVSDAVKGRESFTLKL